MDARGLLRRIIKNDVAACKGQPTSVQGARLQLRSMCSILSMPSVLLTGRKLTKKYQKDVGSRLTLGTVTPSGTPSGMPQVVHKVHREYKVGFLLLVASYY